jgi:hypothetical protein
MSSYPVKRKARPIRTIEGDVADLPASVVKRNAGVAFRYSYAEFSAVGNSAQFKARRSRYENGKLTTESFEGDLDPKTYEHLLSDAQRFFMDQTALYLQALRSFLLPFRKD